MGTITDFTINGKCSQCGQCCSNCLPMTKEEVARIKKHIAKWHIKEQRHNVINGTDWTCPFRDEAHKRCTIYEVRPWICRQFMCNHTAEDIENAKIDISRKADVYFMRKTFFNSNEEVDYMAELRKLFSESGV